ncbi:NAD(P)-dependent alcohol dehydrogenase [Limibacter armeniacum]|uniref:NAD(P)-dependent alcohol dehydrogenase n=1 Tax=Limibacter armeniacum TaxID=466084 RepID=UPI002FE59527
MRQVNYSKYGDSSVLKVTETQAPSITGKDQVLVEVHYSSLNAIDWKNRKGDFRFVSGWFHPRTKQGFDVYGIVVDKSENLKDISIGDKVVGELGNFSGGALSERVMLTKNQFVKVIGNLPEEQLGGLAMAGSTAWQALFENAHLKKGDKVLINGGSSGVGHLAIQLAKAHGAVVTSVSSTKNLDFCKALGADKVIDYTKEDFTTLNEKFDIIFDVVFNASFSKVKGILSENGTYIGTTPSPTLIFDIMRGRQAKFVAVKPNTIALSEMIALMEKGLLKVHVDKVFDMDNIVEAHKQMEQSRTRGKLIIKVKN